MEDAFKLYFEARGRFRLDPEGRSAKHTHTDESDAAVWQLAQMLVDPDDQNDWEASFSLSLVESRAENRPVLRFTGVRAVGAAESTPDTIV